MAKNKVKFGLKNVHIAPIVEGENGELSYEKPFPLKGAVELTMDPVGESFKKYADDGEFIHLQNKQGYDGSLAIALITDEFAQKILGQKLGPDGLLTESADDKGTPFALLCEINGDVRATRYAFFNCSASQPSIGSATKTDSMETQDDELTFTSAIHPTLKKIRTKSTETTPVEVYDAWYDAVPVPAEVEAPVEPELPA